MARNQIRIDIGRMFQAAEQTGLKLAIKGRLVAILLIGLWLLATRGTERAPDIIAALVTLAGLGLVHFFTIGSAYDRPWLKYAFLGIDILLMSIAIALLPPEPTIDLPQIFMFKFDVFHYYYLIIAIAAFSLSPGLVLWAGALGAGGWLGAFAFVRAGMAAPLEWNDAIHQDSRDRFLSVFLDENFAATGSRIQEAIVYVIVAILIATVIQRARQTLHRQLAAEREVATVSQIFGRFVPEVVANSMIHDRGVLDPVERDATVLFIDIAGFTKLTENKGPRATVDILNTYFDAVTEIITKNHGIVTQFQGDGILAVFNVPIRNDRHVWNAFDAASQTLKMVRDSTFAGVTLTVRIGLNTGPVFAGNVGGSGRQTYTVYGDTVNLAARLEAMNKTLETTLLVSETAAELLNGANLKKLGEEKISGISAPVGIYSLKRLD